MIDSTDAQHAFPIVDRHLIEKHTIEPTGILTLGKLVFNAFVSHQKTIITEFC